LPKKPASLLSEVALPSGVVLADAAAIRFFAPRVALRRRGLDLSAGRDLTRFVAALPARVSG
jgi:hypothetical protein